MLNRMHPTALSYQAEADALLDVLDRTPPDVVTGCIGWSAHDLLAHLVAGGVEMSTLASAVRDGDLAPATRGFVEREAPFVALEDGLLRELMAASGTLSGVLNDVHAHNPLMTVPFTGWDMTATMLNTHTRSELALHRWDLVGDDEESRRLLAQPDLTAHAVSALNAFEVLHEAPRQRARRAGVDAEPGFEFCLRSEGQPDVVLTVGPTGVGFRLGGETPPGWILPEDARLLVLWGRLPGVSRRGRVVSTGDRLRIAQRLLFA